MLVFAGNTKKIGIDMRLWKVDVFFEPVQLIEEGNARAPVFPAQFVHYGSVGTAVAACQQVF